MHDSLYASFQTEKILDKLEFQSQLLPPPLKSFYFYKLILTLSLKTPADLEFLKQLQL